MNAVRAHRLASGARLGYRLLGDTAGLVVVFFSGLGASSAALPASLIAPGIGAVCVDRPGYAASSGRAYTPQRFADDTAELLRALGVGDVHVVGHSAGGLYAEHFSRRHPASVRSLSRVSSAPPFVAADGAEPELPEQWSRTRERVRRHPIASRTTFALAGLTTLAPARALDVSDAPEPDRAILADPRLRPALIASVREGWRGLGGGVFQDLRALMTPMDTAPRAAPHPVYLWHGDADTTFPASVLAANRALYLSASVTVLPGEGHLAYLRAWPHILDRALGG